MKYDMLVIGLGPAGMAVSIMGSAMGLKVIAIEQEKIGGECLNVGCIPSKDLLKSAYIRETVKHTERFGLTKVDKIPDPLKPFKRLQDHVKYINEHKTVKMFDKVELIIGKGHAHFTGPKTVEVDGKEYTAKKIYICAGTMPSVPPIPGINNIEYLTNMNMFNLEEIPKSMFIIGGGAIGCEMAQAFSRLGTKIVLAHMDEHLVPIGDKEAAKILEEEFKKEGIEIYNSTSIKKISKKDKNIIIETDKGTFEAEKLLMAAGRKINIEPLELDKAGIKYNKKGIIIDRSGRTNIKNVWAIGDCNGKSNLSHTAMHQGMLSLMSSMMPFKMKYDKYQIPWAVFTDPEFAQVGMTEKELKEKNIKYDITKVNYADYGRTITDEKTVGFVKIFTSTFGKIYGAVIIGASASELIQEFILAIHKNIKIYDIMMMQHTFPTVSFLNKRVSEEWMMNKMKSPFLQKMCKIMFNFF